MLILLAVFGFYLLVLAIVAWAALHPARSPLFLAPSALGVPQEDVEFQSDGITLRGWWVHHPSPRGVAVLCHGYVMNRSENAALAAALYHDGFACLLFDFRSCGKSDAGRMGIGWLEQADVVAACNEAEKKNHGVPRMLIGSSMGAAACAFAVSSNPQIAERLVLDSCYSTLPSATLGWWRFIGGVPAMLLLAPVVLVAWPMARFNPFKADVGKALSNVKCPVLIVHGLQDNLAAPRHAERNHAMTPDSKHVTFEDCGHSESRWSRPDDLLAAIRAFYP